MKRRIPAEVFLLLTTLIWGGTFPVIKEGLADISPLLMVGSRFLLAAIFGWPLLLRRSGGLSRETWLWGALIGAVMFIGYNGQTIGLQTTTVARSGFITYTFALYVPFLQFLILRRKPTLGNLAGLLLVLWGLTFFVDPVTTPLSFSDFLPRRIFQVLGGLGSGGLNVGDVFTLVGAVGMAFYVILLDVATRRVDVGAVTWVQMLVCGSLSLVASPLAETPMIRFGPRLFLTLGYLVVLGSFLALLLMNRFQKSLSPLKAVLIYSLEPVFAAFLGWLLLHDGMSSREIVGAGFIIGGFLVSEFVSMILVNRHPFHADNPGDVST